MAEGDSDRKGVGAFADHNDPRAVISRSKFLTGATVGLGGLIGVAVKGSTGAAVEVNSETDFVARNEFFQGLVNHAFITVHIDNLRGQNAHHQAETVFKAFGRALRMATEADPRSAGLIPSTKGSL